jgi:O-antigen/teichoic acid export membrane protein
MLEATAIIVFLGLNGIISSYIIAVLETKRVFTATLTGNTLKLFLGLGLVYMGYGWTGAVTGYVASWATIIGILFPWSIRRNLPITLPTITELRNLLKAGLSNWTPMVLTLLGQWLGVIAVYGYSGAMQTGYYYIANAIAGFVLGVSTMIMGVMLPVLSGMSDGRKRLTGNALRISLAVITPVSAFLVFYPEPVLGLLGHRYTEASLILSVLSLGYLPVLLTTGVVNLVYSYGMYR